MVYGRFRTRAALALVQHPNHSAVTNTTRDVNGLLLACSSLSDSKSRSCGTATTGPLVNPRPLLVLCRYFFMDGVVLSRAGLNTVRRAMLKGQPKKPPPAPRQRGAHTPSAATPDTHSAMDTAPPSVYTPVCPPPPPTPPRPSIGFSFVAFDLAGWLRSRRLTTTLYLWPRSTSVLSCPSATTASCHARGKDSYWHCLKDTNLRRFNFEDGIISSKPSTGELAAHKMYEEQHKLQPHSIQIHKLHSNWVEWGVCWIISLLGLPAPIVGVEQGVSVCQANAFASLTNGLRRGQPIR